MPVIDDIRCLLFPPPCFGEALKADAGPIAADICGFLQDAASAMSDNLPATKAAMGAATGSSPAVSVPPANVTASTPGCQVDIVAQTLAASEALQIAKKFESVISETIESANEAVNAMAEFAIECGPLLEILDWLSGYSDLQQRCDTVTNTSTALIATLEFQFTSLKDYMDSLFDISFEATNLLQIFANIGLCESDLNFEASITPGSGVASSVSVQP